MGKIEIMEKVALSLLNIPYKWGGDNSHDGYDCSGFIQEVLASVGKDPKGDQDAQTIYNLFSSNGEWNEKLCEGSILFFGKDKNQITHVGIALNSENMIECGGGSRYTISLIDALKQNAKVRIRPIRKDLVCSLINKEWLNEMSANKSRL